MKPTAILVNTARGAIVDQIVLTQEGDELLVLPLRVVDPRGDVLRDRDDPNRFYFYEVYRDEAALEAHRQTPHFKLYFEKSQPLLAAPPERRFAGNVIPADSDWR